MLRLSTVLFIGVAITACGELQNSSPLQQDLSLNNSVSKKAWVNEKLEPQVYIQSTNEEFQTPARIEKQMIAQAGPSPYDDESLWEAAELGASHLFPNIQLKRKRLIRSKLFTYAEFQQIYASRVVFGAQLKLRMDAKGDWLTAQSSLISSSLFDGFQLSANQNIDLSGLEPKDEVIQHFEVIYPRIEEGNVKLYHAQEIHMYNLSAHRSYAVWLDRDSSKILAIHHPQTEFDDLKIVGSILPDTPEDEPVLTELPFVQFKAKGQKILADQNAKFDLKKLLGLQGVINLENRYLAVVDNAGPNNELPLDGDRVESDTMSFDNFSSLQERNIYYWVMKARDYVEHTLDYHELNYQLIAMAHMGQDLDNAFFDPLTNSLAFGAGKSFLKDTALSRDVILHEFGHAVTQSIYGMKASYEFMAMNEAFSDYFAATITNDPYIANDAMRNGMPYLRTVKNDYQYKTFFTGEGFHKDGQLFSGALWDLRQKVGAERADLMIHEARLEGADTIVGFWAALRQIDEAMDDGNYFTPSPLRDDIRHAFQGHGLYYGMHFDTKTKNWTKPWKATESDQRGCWAPPSQSN